MVRVFLITAVCALSISNVHAQDSLHIAGESRLVRYESVIGSCLAFSLLDYVGYNLVVTPNHQSPGSILSLHLFDAAFGSAINYFLYKTCGLSSALSFDLTWWTWGLDLGFSGWGDVINPASPWVNRANSSLSTNAITWAGWTPVGIFHAQKSIIPRNTLYVQAIIGFSISMAMLW